MPPDADHHESPHPMLVQVVAVVLGCHALVAVLLLFGLNAPRWYSVPPTYLAVFLGPGLCLYALLAPRRAEFLPTIIMFSFALTLGVYGFLVPPACWLKISLGAGFGTILVLQTVGLAFILRLLLRTTPRPLFRVAPLRRPGVILGLLGTFAVAVYMAFDTSNMGADSNFYMAYVQRMLSKGHLNSTEIYARGNGVIFGYAYNAWLTLLTVPTYLFSWPIADTWSQIAAFTAPMSVLSLVALVRETSMNRRMALFVGLTLVAGHMIAGIKTSSDYNTFTFIDAPFWDQSPFPRGLAWFVILPAFLVSLRLLVRNPDGRRALMAGLVAVGMLSLHLLGSINLALAALAMAPWAIARILRRHGPMRILMLVGIIAGMMVFRAGLQAWILQLMPVSDPDALGMAPGHRTNLYTFYGTWAKMPFTVVTLWVGVAALFVGGRAGRALGPPAILFGAIACIDPVKSAVAAAVYPGLVGRIATSATFLGWILCGIILYRILGWTAGRWIPRWKPNAVACVAGGLVAVVCLGYSGTIAKKFNDDTENQGGYKEIQSFESSFLKLREWIGPRDQTISLDYRHPFVLASNGGFFIVPTVAWDRTGAVGATEDVVGRTAALVDLYRTYNHFDDASKIHPSDEDLQEMATLLKTWDVPWILTHPRWKLNEVLKEKQSLDLFEQVFEDEFVALYRVKS